MKKYTIGVLGDLLKHIWSPKNKILRNFIINKLDVTFINASIRTDLVNFSEYKLRCKSTWVLQALPAVSLLGHLLGAQYNLVQTEGVSSALRKSSIVLSWAWRVKWLKAKLNDPQGQPEVPMIVGIWLLIGFDPGSQGSRRIMPPKSQYRAPSPQKKRQCWWKHCLSG